MNDILERKIKTIIDNNPGNSTQMEISVECPLDSGVSVIVKWIEDEEGDQAQIDGVRDFFLYIKEYRENNPDHLFNKISIFTNNAQIIDICYFYDELLQKQTIENIK